MNVVAARTWPCAAVGWALAVLAVVPSAKARSLPPMKEMLPWYHSADEIASTLRELSSSCGGGVQLEVTQRTQLNTGSDAGAEVDIDVVHVSKAGGGGDGKLRAMLVFGEHARELISPESALGFVQTLCGSGPQAERARAVLDKVSFTIVPNANPLSRKLVEAGRYCLRTNEDGVDLNRNFGDRHRNSGEVPGAETNPGPSGFSEPETKIIRALIDEERPDIYLSVHSGAYLLGTPFGYKRGTSPATETSMLQVLGPISDKYCDGGCPFGNLAELIHYENPGCDIDYVAESGTPFVFTWEIYTGAEYRAPYVEQAQMRRGNPSLLQQAGRRQGLRRAKLQGEARRSKPISIKREDFQDLSACLNQFVPKSEEETRSVVDRWTGAYLELAERVVASRARGA